MTNKQASLLVAPLRKALAGFFHLSVVKDGSRQLLNKYVVVLSSLSRVRINVQLNV